MVHYRRLIQDFGAPNGLCSSITENKHIYAVKKPYRRTNKNKSLGQMLLVNQRLEKLAAARVYFQARGMLDGVAMLPLPPSDAPDTGSTKVNLDEAAVRDAEDVEGLTSMGDVRLAKTPVRDYPKDISSLAHHLNQPKLPEHGRRYLCDQLYPDAETHGMEAPLQNCPQLSPTHAIKVFHSASSTYHAPSDLSGMHREIIRATPTWHKGPGRYDCVFISKSEDDGFEGMHAARARLFFSFKRNGILYQCALVDWFVPDEREPKNPCPNTGMWIVCRDMDHDNQRVALVVHIDTILRGAHLIPVFEACGCPRRSAFTVA